MRSPKCWRREQTIYKPLVSVGTFVGEKRIDFGNRRRQAEQVQTQPTNQRWLVGLARRVQSFFLQPRQNETVDGVARPRFGFHFRKRRTSGGVYDQWPSHFAPCLTQRENNVNLRFAQFFAEFDRRHVIARPLP